MLLGAFRGGNPLERIVGIPSFWHRLGEVLQKYGLGVSRQLEISGLRERPAEASPNPPRLWTIKTIGGFADHFALYG